MSAFEGLTRRSRDHHFGPNRYADHFVYRCYDAADELLYIGCTNDPKRRMYAHRSGSKALASRWLRVSMARVEVSEPYRGRDAARDAEARAINEEQPLFNYQGRANVHQAAWMTRGAIAKYLVEHGHLELALETVCTCDPISRGLAAFDDFCFSHVAGQVAGLTDLRPFDDIPKAELDAYLAAETTTRKAA